MHLRNLLFQLRPGTLSLKTVLALYFVPISVAPVIFISIYATRVFEESGEEGILRRAGTERDAIVAELDLMEKGLLEQARAHAKRPSLVMAMARKNAPALEETLLSFPPSHTARLYYPNGKLFFLRQGTSPASPIAYISKEGLERVKSRGETVDRYFLGEGQGFVVLVRTLIRSNDRIYGILEEEKRFGPAEALELKDRRQADVIFLRQDLRPAIGSFALQPEILRRVAGDIQSRFRGINRPLYLSVGDSRYAAFLYDIPGPQNRPKRWGYVAVFVSMTALDTITGKLKVAMIYLTCFLILLAALLIFVFSNRLVKPIEALVLAMKRVKAGRVEQIPPLDSTYEIEYLVRSFNEMARNVSAAKRALELKLEEIRRANLEIKNAQTQLVQSAKMASLGQLVAGVAHELNNPIGFIYSNMHHLQDYVSKVRSLVQAYRETAARLSEQDRKKLSELEAGLEIDFILKDMQDLARSCLDGANRTKEIVTGLRTFSRMEESAFRPADIHEGIRSTLKLLNAEIKGRITVHEEFGNLPLVECNLSQLNQVFMNLLSNAAQAIEGRGEIWVRTTSVGESVLIAIQDSGAGIAEDAIEKIFDPFFTTKKVGQGTGLGLSIAYGLIERHGGRINVKSQLGKGTTFEISLPIRQPASAAAV